MFRSIGGAIFQTPPNAVTPLTRSVSTANTWTINDAHHALRALCRHPNSESFNEACLSLSAQAWQQSQSPGHSQEAIYAFEEISRFALELSRLNCNYQVGELAASRSQVAGAPHPPVSLTSFARPEYLKRMIHECIDRCETHAVVRNALSREALKGLAQFSRSGHLPDGASASTLSAQEALFLVDYVHPVTGTFAAVTMAKRAEQYGNRAASKILSPLLFNLDTAIEKLTIHPDFRGDPGKTLYKGFRLSQAGQAALRRVTEQARHYSFGQPLSTTSVLACAYGADRGNNSLLVFKGLPHAQCDGLIFADTRMGGDHLNGGKNDESEDEEDQTELRHELQASSGSDDPSTRLGNRASVQGHEAW